MMFVSFYTRFPIAIVYAYTVLHVESCSLLPLINYHLIDTGEGNTHSPSFC